MADKVTDFAEYRIRQIELAESRYYKTLIDTLDKIEKRVVNLVASDLKDLEKVAQLRVAIKMRPKIKTILEQEYLKWSDTVVREGFNKQAKRIERAFKQIGNIPKRFQQLTTADLSLIKNLKNQTFTQFKDVSNTFTRRLSEKVYQSVLAGVDFAELEQEMRQTINGIYASSKDAEVNKLVSKIKRDEVKVRSIDKRTTSGRAVRE